MTQDPLDSPPSPTARVKMRAIGSLFFSFFGALWLTGSLAAFGVLTRWTLALLAALTLGFIGAAVRILRRTPRIPPSAAQRRNGRVFLWVNIVQWVSIFAIIQVAAHLHRPNAAFPAIALIVGLHFFALPGTFRHRSNLITGTLLVLSAIVCPLLFHGDTMVGAVTLCAGVLLWVSAFWALRTASRVAQSDPRAQSGPPSEPPLSQESFS